MEEKFEKNIKRKEESKLEWETTKLICLKTDKTFGGKDQNYSEDDSYTPGPS